MSQESEQFEKMVARIHELLEDQGSEVVWNEKIPDPDNPKQLRQIDVLVKNGDFTTFIECRLHKEKQNVKWVEELMGRKISLNADLLIGVSSSGFTEGAILKAANQGIYLRDVLNIEDEEICAWSKYIKVTFFFYFYDDFELNLFFDKNESPKISNDQIKKELLEFHGVNAIFNFPHNFIDEQNLILEENRNKVVKFGFRFKVDDLIVGDKVVREIEITGSASLKIIKLNLPFSLAYGDPLVKKKDRSVIIDKYDFGLTEIIIHNGKISVKLDISKFSVPPFWQFRFFEVEAKDEVDHEKLEILNLQNLNMEIDRCKLNVGELNV